MGELIPIHTARAARIRRGGGESLARAARRAELTRIRAGAYLESSTLAALTDADLHLARIQAARLAASAEPIFSHESAAALHGVPLIGAWPDRVRVTVGPTGASSTAPVHRTRRSLAEHDIVRHESGALATSAIRTAIDLAATRSLLSGIVAFSHLRHDGAAIETIAEAIERCGMMRGVRQARLALARSTQESESVLETLVWTRLQDYCFEVPQLQRTIVGIDGKAYRVDFAWQDGLIVLEADGRSKYAAADQRGRMPSEVLWAEKRREDAIRPRTRAFIRITWSDAWSGHELARRVTAAGVPRRERCASALTF